MKHQTGLGSIMNLFNRLLGKKPQEKPAPTGPQYKVSDSDSESDMSEIRSPAVSSDVNQGTTSISTTSYAKRDSRSAISAPHPSTRLRHSSMDAGTRFSTEPGTLGSKYSHISLLHRGRRAIIYRALQRKTGAPVVLKAYQYEYHDLAHKEAELLQRCAHLPGIVRLLEQLEEQMVVYNVLEGCQGGTLIEWVAKRGGRMPEADVAVDIALPLLRILEALRGPGVMHRDIKPEHIVRGHDGLKLVDFVVAADLGHDKLNTRVGTLEYMAPEVLAMPTPDDLATHLEISGGTEEELPVYSTAADLWSLGCVLYEAISGCQPFLGETTEEMVHLQMCCLEKGACAIHKRDASALRRKSDVLEMELDNSVAEADLAAAVAQALGSSAGSHLYDSSSPNAAASGAAVPQAAHDPSRVARSLHTGEVLPQHAPLPTDNIGNAVVEGQFLLKHSRSVEKTIDAAASAQQHKRAQQQQHQEHQHNKVELPVVRGFDQATEAPDIFTRHMFSAHCISFLKCLLNWEAAKRVDPSELIHHPWIQLALAERHARKSFSIPRSQPVTPRTTQLAAEGTYEISELLPPVPSPSRQLRRSRTWDEPYVPKEERPPLPARSSSRISFNFGAQQKRMVY